MPVRFTTTSYGAAAYDALREVVRHSKAGDPLRQVNVVVPSERVGVTARRALARGDAAHGPGIAAVQLLTMRRLAENLAAEQLLAQDRRPLTGPVLAEAVRVTLEEHAGRFDPVKHHTGTVRALAEAHRQLRPLDAVDTDRLRGAAAPIVTETLRVHDHLQAHLSSTYDETDLLRAAIDRVEQVGDPVVVFLPQDLDPPEIELLAALSARTDVHLVIGLTGDAGAGADAGPRRAATALGLVVPDVEPQDATATSVVHASDPDDEVREVVRRVVTCLRHFPGHRVAVLHGSGDPYARLLHEHLHRAGVTFFGRGVRPAVETAYGRTLLRLLGLPDHDHRRADLLAVIADGPVLVDGRRAPSSAWERVSRATGIVRGADWPRLADYATRARQNATDERAKTEARLWLADRHERQAEAAEGLLAFVDDLREHLDAVEQAESWRAAATAVRALSTAFLPDEDALAPEDASAARRVRTTLDAVTNQRGTPTRGAMSGLLELELDAVLDRVGTMGVGVHVGPVSEGVGDDVDVVHILGAAEGLLPPRSADDPLLPDRVREETEGALPTLVERTARQHRHVLAALAAAPRDGRTISFPRGDLRRGGERVPSRWLLPTLRAMSGRDDLQVTQWREVGRVLDASPSYVGGLAAARNPANAQEWRQREAMEAARQQVDLPEDDEIIACSRELRRARASAEFTAFDGNLAGEDIPDPTQHHRLSPTALEEWTKCPQAYFQHQLLGVAPIEEADEVIRISPLERGNVLHEVWERLVLSALEEGWAPGPGKPWPDRTIEVIEALAEEEGRKAVDRGVTGFPLLWAQDERVLRRDLAAWVPEDDARRAALNEAVPVGAEYSFGRGQTPPATIDLGDGRVLRLRGLVDRIDRRRNGGLVVTDYKTGKSDRYKLSDSDPTQRGQRLQLPLYALAARDAFGEPATPVRAEYWFTSLKGNFVRRGYDVTDEVLERTRESLRVIVDGIREGTFPARPTKDPGSVAYDCAWCNAGADDVSSSWQRKTSAATALRAMLHGEEDA